VGGAFGWAIPTGVDTLGTACWMSGLRARVPSLEPAKDEGSDALVGGIGVGSEPFGRMSGVVEARRGVEDGARRSRRVLHLELAARDPITDDPAELGDERVDVPVDELACLRGELDVGGEELGVVEGLCAL
jgi:hypothetical protein